MRTLGLAPHGVFASTPWVAVIAGGEGGRQVSYAPLVPSWGRGEIRRYNGLTYHEIQDGFMWLQKRTCIA